MTNPADELEAEARALFESDTSSKYEADWDNLAFYKRNAWIDQAEIVRLREARIQDDEIPYPEWMEENLYDSDNYRDYHEEAYNEMLMNGDGL